MHAKLVSVDASHPNREIKLEDFPVIIGRSAAAGIQLKDSWVSKAHCQLEARDDTLVVRDLGSRNGTLVNGSLAKETRLSPGDKLTIGLSSFVVSFA
jgi:pSer/pThr/pTyr-binding forkhead associated (FHA) protein